MTTKNVDDLSIEELNQQVAICENMLVCPPAHYDPCHNAQQAFEIMDKYKIGVFPVYKNNSHYWESYLSYKAEAKGDTALIAICRCYVKYVKGETVEV